jgi:uncharacterized membrane protein YhaH (DUF805 family)
MDNNNSSDKQGNPEKSGNISRKKYLWVIGTFTLLGVTGGYLYYYFIGCNNGCTIQSNPYLSMIWGGAMGYLLPDMVLKPRKG